MSFSLIKPQLEENVLLLKKKSDLLIGLEVMELLATKTIWVPQRTLSSKDPSINTILSFIQRTPSLFLTVDSEERSFEVEFLDWDAKGRLHNFIWLDIKYYSEDITSLAATRLGQMIKNIHNKSSKMPSFIQISRY